MRYLISCIGILAFIAVYTQTSTAQVGFAVAIDEDRSGLYWQMSMAESTSKANTKARSRLKSKGYDRITTQPCSRKCGFELSSGYWVVVQSDYKIYDGSTKTGFGLGVSSNSRSEAEQRAVKNLSTYHWSWSRSDEYSINKSGTF